MSKYPDPNKDCCSLFACLSVDHYVLQHLEHNREIADWMYIIHSYSVPLLESETGSSVSSCNHLVHFRCFVQSHRADSERINMYICPVCRRLLSHIHPILLDMKTSVEFNNQLKLGPTPKTMLLEQGKIPLNQSILNNLTSLRDYSQRVYFKSLIHH